MSPSRLADVVRQRSVAVDSHDATAFPFGALRTRALRLAIAGAAVALVIAAAASARGLERRSDELVPRGTTAVVVVDLSLSILDKDYELVRRVLRRLVAENASIGLVVFSDVAYELLPPGTPASELRPVLRLLTSRTSRPPVNPWVQAFRAGTRISSALDLAQQMLERDRVRSKSIVLVSDLETAPDDVPALTRTVERLRRGSIALRVVGLGPSSDARRIFEGLLEEGIIDPAAGARDASESRAVTRTRVPEALLALGALLFLALAANERFTGRVALTRGLRSDG